MKKEHTPTWITNDPETAKTLKAIDAIYEATRTAARSLSLDAKIITLRDARKAKFDAYAAIAKGEA